MICYQTDKLVGCARDTKATRNHIGMKGCKCSSCEVWSSVFIVKFSVRFKTSISGFAPSEAKLTLKSPVQIIGFLSSSDPMIAVESGVYSTKSLCMKVITAATGLPGHIKTFDWTCY
ncbi:hypothetical protein TNCV_4237521 [Trichonephila clavipes]|nr:hypothetical protein TNCV_4237521 [Trichonephila clavipes]